MVLSKSSVESVIFTSEELVKLGIKQESEKFIFDRGDLNGCSE